MYYVIHLDETDGNIHYEECADMDAVASYVESHFLYEGDYRIFKGQVITHV